MYLTYLLKDLLIKSGTKDYPSRIISVTSDLHHFAKSIDFDNVMLEPKGIYDAAATYRQSKLCNILFANELARKFGDRNIRVHSAQPGSPVESELSRNYWLGKIL